MTGILKETDLISKYWLEPRSSRVEPDYVAVTNMKGEVLESVPYRDARGIELKATPTGRLGILLDFGKEVGGYPNLVMDTGRCRKVGAQAVEAPEHLFSPLTATVASVADHTVYHEHFKSAEGKHVELPHCGGFRYIWLYPELPGRASIREAWVEYTPYFTADRSSCGYFLCSDDLLNRIWFSSLHTLEMCTVDPALGGVDGRHSIGEGKWVLVDGAKRDRLIWTGDIAPMGMAAYVSDYNTAAVRDSLLSLSDYQQRDGYIPACSPGPMLGRIASGFFGDYVAWWIVSLHQYFMHTDDRETVAEVFPNVKRALHYLHDQCRGGLFRQTPLNMMEWCFTVLRLGKPSYTNIMYYWALNCASHLAYVLDEEDVSIGYVSRAYRLGEVIERELWDRDRGVFIDTSSDRDRVPQDANSLAVVSGLVEEPGAKTGLLDYIRENMWEEYGSTNVDLPYYRFTPGLQPHNKRVVPFMNNYEVLARFISGDREGAMQLIRNCWGSMVDSGHGSTFWEWKGADGEMDNHFCSLCHGWSAGAAPLLSKFVLGVSPAGSGYRLYSFEPWLGELEWAEGKVPVPGGFIEVRLEKNKDGSVDSKVRAPTGLKARGED